MILEQAMAKLQYLSYKVTLGGGKQITIIEKHDVFRVLENVTKNYNLTDVDNERELLITFMESLTTEDLKKIEIAEFDSVADKFLDN